MAKPKQLINTQNLDSKPSNQKTTFPETGLQHSTTLFRLRLCITAVISHTRPSTIFFPFQKVRFGGRQSNVSMTITASAVTGTTISMSVLRVSELLFHLYLTRR